MTRSRAATVYCVLLLSAAAIAPRVLAGEPGGEESPAAVLKRLEKRLTEIEKRLAAVENRVVASDAGRQKALPPLQESKVSLQSLIDKAEDGAVVKVPRARYVSENSVVIKSRGRLTVRCEKGTEILCSDVNKDVLQITGSSQVTVEGALLRHTKPLGAYACHGSVVRVEKSTSVTIAQCELNGCGAVGLYASGSKTLVLSKCLVQKNSFTALYLDECTGVKIHDNIIRGNANLMQLHEVDDLDMSGNDTRRNSGYWGRLQTLPGPDR